MSLFGKKPDVKEQIRAQDRDMRRTQRELERDRTALERQEKQLEQQIKQAAQRGDRQSATILAKQLVQLRKQKTKSFAVSSKVQSIGNQTKVMHSNMKMAQAMGSTTKVMTNMNKVMDPQKTMQTMQAFERESAKMGMTEDMINDTLDDILDESGDEEEQDSIVNQVLDEIGIEISGQVRGAPRPMAGKLGDEASGSRLTDNDLEKQLAALKSL